MKTPRPDSYPRRHTTMSDLKEQIHALTQQLTGLETFMANTMQDVLDKLAAIDVDVKAIAAKPPVVQLATQEQIDAAAAAADQVSADLAPLK